MVTISYHSFMRLLCLCGISLVVFTDGALRDGNRYRALYATEIRDMRDSDITSETFHYNLKEFNHVRSECICLQHCLSVPNCLSFLWNGITKLCRLFSIYVASHMAVSDVIQNRNRYYSVSTGGCDQDGYVFNIELNLCWKAVADKRNYSDALLSCQNDRARLLQISSFPVWNYLETELAEHAMSLFWVQGTTNGSHVINDDGTVSEFMSHDIEESGEMDPSGRFIIAKQQGYHWMNVPSESKNGFLCQVASTTRS